MSIINFGSLNIDHTYSVPHFVQPGETLKSDAYHIYCGGKGLNQSVAAAKAGSTVHHSCMAGVGSSLLTDYMTECGVDLSLMGKTDTPQGHAIIQVNSTGENSIFLFAGSNFEVSREYIDSVFAQVAGSHYVILQNETSNVDYIVSEAFRHGHKVVLNASPFEASLRNIDLNQVSWLMVNEIEGAEMTGETEPEAILAVLQAAAPSLGIVLTLGGNGSLCCKDGRIIRQGIFPVQAVDTTGAGDTFTGYFVAALDSGCTLETAMQRAAAASAIAVTRKGASPSIPTYEEVDAFLSDRS